MVKTLYAATWIGAAWLVGAQAGKPLILRLEPRDRARVLAALAAVILLGFALIALAWWGARATRRYMNRGPDAKQPGRSATHGQDDWATKPLNADADAPKRGTSPR